MDLHELEAIAEREQAQRPHLRILCCAAAGCQASGALEIKRRLELVLSAAGKLAEVEWRRLGVWDCVVMAHWCALNLKGQCSSG
jgi:bidirectional [NiFe] hydrogenase diaphorase subunit